MEKFAEGVGGDNEGSVADHAGNLPVIDNPSPEFLNSALDSFIAELENVFKLIREEFFAMTAGNLESKGGEVVHNLRCKLSAILEKKGVIEVDGSGDLFILHPNNDFVRLLDCFENLFVGRRINLKSGFIRSGVVGSVSLENSSIVSSVKDDDFPFEIVFRFDFEADSVKGGVIEESLFTELKDFRESLFAELESLRRVLSVEQGELVKPFFVERWKLVKFLYCSVPISLNVLGNVVSFEEK